MQETSPATDFPASWLELIATHSRLGPGALQLVNDLEARVRAAEATGAAIFPLAERRYQALKLVAPEQTKVVIIGQDPYHGLVKLADGTLAPEATGLSFSVPRGARLPPSLRNIFKELASDLGLAMPGHGDLTPWAAQGVLLLNTVLSVEQDKPKSHDKFGWQTLTAALVEALSSSRSGLVFMLWGNSAKALQEHIASNGHTIIASSHPSPIGGSCNKGFFGSRPFSRANAALTNQGQEAIDWAL